MNNKVVLLTGGFGGIGKASAKLLGQNGYKVYLTSRDIGSKKVQNTLEEFLNKKIEVFPIKLDLSNSDSIKKAVNEIIEKEGKIDILINNAATGYFSSVEDIDSEKLRKSFEVNVIGTIELIKNVIPIMRKQGSGRIINISSILGFSTVPLNAPYSMTKYATESFSETLATELAPFGVDVVILQPGDFHSDFIKNAIHAKYDDTSPYFKLYKRKDDKIAAGTGGRDPEFFAEKLFKIIETEKPKLRYTIGKEVLIKKVLHKLLIDKLWIKFLRFFYNW